jgi:hypothetical protein
MFYAGIWCCLVFLFCKEAGIEKKFDPNLRLKLRNMSQVAPSDQSILIVFKMNEKITDKHKEIFEQNGVHLIANIGQICTANVPAQKIIDLAKMKFVDYIQSSRNFETASSDSIKPPAQK